MASDLVFDLSTKAKASRLSFGEELVELGSQDSRIVALDADLSKSTRTDLFAAKFPDRFFNCGIAEANMIGMAAGFSRAGLIPFAASFGCFLTGRFDQIRMSVSFSQTKVRLVGTHAGVGIGEDGHSQMALEDLALMRVLPNMTVFQPGDDWDTRQFMKWSLGHPGPAYLRLTRQNLPSLKGQRRSFEMGRWDVIMPSSQPKILVLGTGALVEPSVLAAIELNSQMGNGSVEFVNANWIAPLDMNYLKDSLARRPMMIVTCEDHYVDGGLGGAVAEVLSEMGSHSRLLRIGVRGFGQSGSPEANYEHYGFTAKAIYERIRVAFLDLTSQG